MASRRHFIKQSTLGGAALVAGLKAPGALSFFAAPPAGELYTVSNQLMHEWAAALLKLQVTDKSSKDYGGIYCAADKAVHGRVGDTIYPFLHLAHKTGQQQYADAAVLLFEWMEKNVSQPDGSWLNEPVAGSWKGTTVFAAIALAESLKHHSAVMDAAFKKRIEDRLYKAADFVYTNFNMEYGNINYPVTAAYGLSLIGSLLDVPKFKEKAKSLADASIKYFTPGNKLLFGEGDITTPSKKGCYAIDLGYNVEETLPALVQYGLLNKEESILEAVTASMQQHLEFMLPDGGWDNSWGTRNYKWTYYGSRTSDGCQPAYALLSHRNSRFYKAALLNTKLMQTCTHNGLLQGGMHNALHGITPCVHHTFSHIKALTTILDHHIESYHFDLSYNMLPRKVDYGAKFFPDIQTCLVSKGIFRATITGYDKEYKKTRNGHATGGALTMLWNSYTGVIFCASMNEYQLYEAGNMQADTDPLSMPLTPRIELKQDGKTFMNISDLSASIEIKNEAGYVEVITRSKLVDKDQQHPASGVINCEVKYKFEEDKFTLSFNYDDAANDKGVKIILPFIVTKINDMFRPDGRLQLLKDNSIIFVKSNHALKLLPTTKNGKIFNHVPGFEAMPYCIEENHAVIELTVSQIHY